MLKKVSIATLFVILAACAAQEPTVQTGPDAEVVLGTLHRIDGGRASLAYVNPEVDFSQYQAFLINELKFDGIVIEQPPREFSARNKEWVLEEKDKAKLAKLYREAVEKELTKGGYPLATAPGKGVLRVTAKLLRIAPTAPKDDFKSRPLSRTAYLTEGAGEMFIGAAFSDGESDEVLALIKDSKEGGHTWRLNNRMNNIGDVRRIFSSWARQLRARLDIIHGGDFNNAK